MNWVFALVTIGLTGILVEMLVSYLKEADEVRAERDRELQEVQAHQQAMEQAKVETGETNARLVELEATSKDVKKKLSEARKQLGEFQAAEQRRHPTRHKLDEE